MRINHNIAALNTYRQLSSASANQSKSMEKLASVFVLTKQEMMLLVLQSLKKCVDKFVD